MCGNGLIKSAGGSTAEDEAYQCMTTALKHGVNFFDNAETYAAGQSETVMGKILAKWFKDGLPRAQLARRSLCRTVQALGPGPLHQAVLGRRHGRVCAWPAARAAVSDPQRQGQPERRGTVAQAHS